jgi:hypothetical protein
MNEQVSASNAANMRKADPFRVRLPGFVTGEEVGLGDLVKHVSYKMGITPCGGCEKRAEALNRQLVFAGKRTGGN